MSRSLLFVLTFFCLFGAAEAAQVGSEGGGEVVFVAEPGEANRVRLTSTGIHEHVVVDQGAPLTAVGACTSVDAHTARCRYDPSCTDPCGESGNIVILGNGRDRARFVGLADGGRVEAGAGRDRIVSDDFGLDVDAGSGDDVVLGGSQSDTLDGGAGADVLNGRGGDGDTASYGARSDAVTVTLDARANDGEPGEGDFVLGIEWVYGGSGADLLVGRAGGVVLSGSDGDDELIGGRARDLLDGGGDNDKLDGAGGDDALLGDAGNDELRGERGPDELYGHNCMDVFWGGAGDDKIVSFDFGPAAHDPVPDRIRCGPGHDTVHMEMEDRAGRSCEVVHRGTPRM